MIKKTKAKSSFFNNQLFSNITNNKSIQQAAFSGVTVPTSSARTTGRSVRSQTENYCNFLNKKKCWCGVRRGHSRGRQWRREVIMGRFPYCLTISSILLSAVCYNPKAKRPSWRPGSWTSAVLGSKHLSLPETTCIPTPSPLRTGSTSTPFHFTVQETCVILWGINPVTWWRAPNCTRNKVPYSFLF